MFDFSDAQLESLVIHKVGNKHHDEGLVVSPGLTQLKDVEVEQLLMEYFLSSFKGDTLYRFHDDFDINLNKVYSNVSKIFLEKDEFYEQSISILQHLYENSTHPNIKSGEFYMAYITGALINGNPRDVIGIFKTENKDIYLKVTEQNQEFDVDYERGINVKKLDKGCLVFNANSQDGFKVGIVDKTNKEEEEALFWKNDFLGLAELQDDNFHTKTYMGLCQDFCENIYGTIYEADKKEQVEFLDGALDYFTEKSQFDVDRFADEVIQDPQCREDFVNYKEDFEEAHQLEPRESFNISEQAVSKMKRKFKGTIKLDTGIQIKIENGSGGTRQIERGFDDERRMHFYKIYFNEEE